jgi:hypothetical protein
LDGRIGASYGGLPAVTYEEGPVMEHNVERGHPAPESIAALEPSHLWVIGLAVDDEGAHVAPSTRPYSFWADCECPDDCLRDHANE